MQLCVEKGDMPIFLKTATMPNTQNAAWHTQDRPVAAFWVPCTCTESLPCEKWAMVEDLLVKATKV